MLSSLLAVALAVPPTPRDRTLQEFIDEATVPPHTSEALERAATKSHHDQGWGSHTSLAAGDDVDAAWAQAWLLDRTVHREHWTSDMVALATDLAGRDADIARFGSYRLAVHAVETGAWQQALDVLPQVDPADRCATVLCFIDQEIQALRATAEWALAHASPDCLATTPSLLAQEARALAAMSPTELHPKILDATAVLAAYADGRQRTTFNGLGGGTIGTSGVTFMQRGEAELWLGHAAARAGDPETARAHWQQAYKHGLTWSQHRHRWDGAGADGGLLMARALVLLGTPELAPDKLQYALDLRADPAIRREALHIQGDLLRETAPDQACSVYSLIGD